MILPEDKCNERLTSKHIVLRVAVLERGNVVLRFCLPES